MPRVVTPASGRFTFPPPPLPPITGDRSAEIAKHFGLDIRPSASKRRQRCPLRAPASGELMLLTGASGSGKSSLLRSLRKSLRRATAEPRTLLDLRRVALPERPVVELFPDDVTLERTLKRLARVGLAEVWTWLRPPSQLSEGQRWRLRVALAIAHAERSATPCILVCDEFAAVLDRVSACIVASVLRRAIDAAPDRLRAVVATSHDDLVTALAPDITVVCDFGEFTTTRRERAR